MKSKTFLASALLALAVPQAFGWGQKGHDTVAYIAQCHLTPTALTGVERLLDGKSIVYWSNWLDNASNTPQYRHTKTWHYRNIDAGQDYDTAPRNEQGDVVTAVETQYAILQDPQASREDRQTALKILIHCVGDLHQPMHMGHLSDRGGNQWPVKYFNRERNLHGIWDSDLVESAHKWSHTEWQREIDRVPSGGEAAVIASRDPSEWGRETFAVATDIYDTTPQDFNVSYGYIANWTPVIESQLLKGGHRLAYLLNTLFDPEYADPLSR